MTLYQAIDRVTEIVVKWWLLQLSGAAAFFGAAFFGNKLQFLQEISPLLLGSTIAVVLLWLGSSVKRWHESRLKPFGGCLWNRQGHPYCFSHRLALTPSKDNEGRRQWVCPSCNGRAVTFSDEHGNEISKEKTERHALSRKPHLNPLTIKEAVWGTPTRSQDVTDVVRRLIEDGIFEFKAETSLDDGPFDDPHKGVLKNLTVTYSTLSKTQTKKVNEHEIFDFD